MTVDSDVKLSASSSPSDDVGVRIELVFEPFLPVKRRDGTDVFLEGLLLDEVRVGTDVEDWSAGKLIHLEGVRIDFRDVGNGSGK